MTEIGKTFEREEIGGGAFRSTLHLRPISYFENGAYRRINDTFVDSGVVGRPHIVTAAPLMVSIANDGMRRIHPTRDVDKYIEIGAPYIRIGGVWTKVNLGAPTRSGNRLSWSSLNADAQIAHFGHGVKLGIELKNGFVPSAGLVAFPVGIQGLTRTGSAIRDGGVTVMNITPPHIEDISNPRDKRPIEFNFTNVTIGGQTQPVLLMTLPDLAGMARPLIDPTLSLQPDGTSGLDAYLQSDTPTTNYGANTLLYVGDLAGIKLRTLIKFDFSSVTPPVTVTSAVLSLYLNAEYSSNARDFKVYRSLRAWVEAQATYNVYSLGNNWATAGGFGAADTEQTSIATRAFSATEAINEFKDWSLDVTAVAAMINGSFTNNGFYFKADTESADAHEFRSSDHGTANTRPKMVVDYTEAAAARHMMYYKRLRG